MTGCQFPHLAASTANRYGCRCQRCLAYFNKRRARWRQSNGPGVERERERHRERMRDRRAAGESV